MKIVITESQYSALTRRYVSPGSIEELVDGMIDLLGVKKPETFNTFYSKIKKHVAFRIKYDMLKKNTLDNTDYVNNKLNDLVEKIEKEVYSYIDNNLKDKIEDYYLKKTNKKKTNLDEVELTERCWKGYTQKGMKTMFGKRYPNCVKIKKK